jgi:hypothetical protein
MALSEDDLHVLEDHEPAGSPIPAVARQVVHVARATPGTWLSLVHGMVDLATKPMWWGIQQLSRGSGRLLFPKQNGE